MKLVIIAAGMGSRIRSVTQDMPKTLLPMGSQRIIDYLIQNCSVAGIDEVILVTGYNCTHLDRFVAEYNGPVKITPVHNPQWELANGVSVLAAKPLVEPGESFLLSMSDHLYGPDLLKEIMTSSLDTTTANVGLDFQIDSIFDLDDGMKVQVDAEDRFIITGMEKTLTAYDAIDCGVFNCSYEFFASLENAQARGNCSLSDACNELIANRRMGGVDIKGNFWLDVDTPDAYQHCSSNRLYEKAMAQGGDVG